MTVHNDPATLTYAQLMIDAAFISLQDIFGVQLRLTYEPLPRSITNLSMEKGGNMLGLNNTQDNLIRKIPIRPTAHDEALIRPVLRFDASWTDPTDDPSLNAAAENWVTSVQQFSASAGTNVDFLYLNYAASFQDPLASYGAANLAFMRQVSQKYDPEQVFQNLVPGGFKLGSAVASA